MCASGMGGASVLSSWSMLCEGMGDGASDEEREVGRTTVVSSLHFARSGQPQSRRRRSRQSHSLLISVTLSKL